mmetsp:Transcript_79440/g.246401  ORF Transcript_79440/g.246401 Transcript_79440/m.246401 type:complete len:293 (-) Transcript_79440:804-1682(-)
MLVAACCPPDMPRGVAAPPPTKCLQLLLSVARGGGVAWCGLDLESGLSCTVMLPVAPPCVAKCSGMAWPCTPDPQKRSGKRAAPEGGVGGLPSIGPRMAWGERVLPGAKARSRGDCDLAAWQVVAVKPRKELAKSTIPYGMATGGATPGGATTGDAALGESSAALAPAGAEAQSAADGESSRAVPAGAEGSAAGPCASLSVATPASVSCSGCFARHSIFDMAERNCTSSASWVWMRSCSFFTCSSRSFLAAAPAAVACLVAAAAREVWSWSSVFLSSRAWFLSRSSSTTLRS